MMREFITRGSELVEPTQYWIAKSLVETFKEEGTYRDELNERCTVANGPDDYCIDVDLAESFLFDKAYDLIAKTEIRFVVVIS